MKTTSGINGFGRFGQHLLKYWIEKGSQSSFTIDYINDPKLSLADTYEILIHDQYLSSFYKKCLSIEEDNLFVKTDGGIHKIQYTKSEDNSIPWTGNPNLFFECSGKNTNAELCRKFLKGNTKLVLISATSPNADKTLIYGFNHQDYTNDDQIISYGSCTVNAYVPLTQFINNKYGVIDSDVNVIHNIPEYTLNDKTSLVRKSCTLETSAPRLLDFITKENFKVNYTNVPYTGISIIDLRYRLEHVPAIEEIFENLFNAINKKELASLYAMEPEDKGPETYKFKPFSAVLIQSGIKLIGNNLYIHAYFDNENSVTRFYDLAQYIAKKKEN